MSKKTQTEIQESFYGYAKDGKKLPLDRIAKYDEMKRLQGLNEEAPEARVTKSLEDCTVKELKWYADHIELEVKGNKKEIIKTLKSFGVSIKEDGEFFIEAKEEVESTETAEEVKEEVVEETTETETEEVEVKNNDEEFKAFIKSEKLEKETTEKKIREYAQSKEVEKFDTKKLVELTKELNITKEAAK